MRVCFHLDEHMPYALADGLRRRGIDVTATPEAGLLSAADSRQLTHALESARVFVTHDRDYLRIAAAGVPHAGIAYCPKGSKTLGEMIRFLVLMHDVMSAEEMQNRVEHIA